MSMWPGIPSLVCPGCGLHAHDIFQSTYLGCPLCYETFAEQISPMIWKQQGSTVHHGKHTELAKPDRDYQRELYRRALEKATREERGHDIEVLNSILDEL